MPMVSSARRYAEAVFSIALERNELEKWRTDLRRIAQVIKEPELVLAVADPRKPLPQKQGLLKACLPDMGPLALNLATLLVAKGRTKIADRLAAEYELLVDARLGIEHVQVTTAVPLDAEEKQALLQRLVQAVGKKIVLEARVDPRILGGLKIRVGDRLVDGSTASNLRALRRSLAGAKG